MPQQIVNFTPSMESQYLVVRDEVQRTFTGKRKVAYSQVVTDALHTWAEEIRAGTASISVDELKTYLDDRVNEIYVQGASFTKHTIYLSEDDNDDLETIGDHLVALPDYTLPNLQTSKAKYNNTLIIALALRKRYEQITKETV